ncbi:hypothetical protein PR048_033591 [Dryococelus australis]|uniref:Uncharacterized protein n=1 Tax=Dryococelus australis TaxID=614101 RepID=A0ABQ9G3R5_9NEOP|nr:hypothetical protein PR048_033591 [Dryococelus australis]
MHNFRCLATIVPRQLHERPLHSLHVTVWYTVGIFVAIGPYFLRKKCVQLHLWPLGACKCYARFWNATRTTCHHGCVFFQHDGATAHSAQVSIAALRKLFRRQRGLVTWRHQTNVRRYRPRTIDQLKPETRHEIANNYAATHVALLHPSISCDTPFSTRAHRRGSKTTAKKSNHYKDSKTFRKVTPLQVAATLSRSRSSLLAGRHATRVRYNSSHPRRVYVADISAASKIFRRSWNCSQHATPLVDERSIINVGDHSKRVRCSQGQQDEGRGNIVKLTASASLLRATLVYGTCPSLRSNRRLLYYGGLRRSAQQASWDVHLGRRHMEKDAGRHSALPSYRRRITQHGLILWLLEGIPAYRGKAYRTILFRKIVYSVCSAVRQNKNITEIAGRTTEFVGLTNDTILGNTLYVVRLSVDPRRDKDIKMKIASPLATFRLNIQLPVAVSFRLDSTVLYTLEPQMVVHWLLLQRVASATSHLAVWHSLLVSSQRVEEWEYVTMTGQESEGGGGMIVKSYDGEVFQGRPCLLTNSSRILRRQAASRPSFVSPFPGRCFGTVTPSPTHPPLSRHTDNPHKRQISLKKKKKKPPSTHDTFECASPMVFHAAFFLKAPIPRDVQVLRGFVFSGSMEKSSGGGVEGDRSLGGEGGCTSFSRSDCERTHMSEDETSRKEYSERAGGKKGGEGANFLNGLLNALVVGSGRERPSLLGVGSRRLTRRNRGTTASVDVGSLLAVRVDMTTHCCQLEVCSRGMLFLLSESKCYFSLAEK